MAITYTAWSTPANSTGDGYQWGWSFRVGVEVFQRSGGQVVVRCFAQERVVGILSQTFIYSGVRNVAAVLSVGGQTRQLNMQWQDVHLESPVGGETVGEERMFGEYAFDVGTGAGTASVSQGHATVSNTEDLNVDVWAPGEASQGYAETAPPATAPNPPTEVAADNLFGGAVSDTRVDVVWEPGASAADKPLSGFRVYLGDAVVASAGPLDSSASVTLKSFRNLARTLSVAAYGDGGESARVAANPVYGNLDAPTCDVWRGWRDGEGYAVSATVGDATPQGAYAHAVEVEYDGGSGWGRRLDAASQPGQDHAVEVGEGDGYSREAVRFRYRTVPKAQGAHAEAASAWAESTVAKGPAEVPWVAATQTNNLGIGFVVVEFAKVEEDDPDTGYTYNVTFTGPGALPGAFDVEADGESPTYSSSQQFMGGDEVYVHVTPSLNGWDARPTTSRYRYHAMTLRPPTLLSMDQDGGDFSVSFSPATGGSPFGEVGRIGYRYRVYVNGERVASDPDQSQTVWGEGPHAAAFEMLDPYEFRVWMTAVDSLGDESRPSNSMWGRYNPGAAGCYAFGCDLILDGVAFSGCKTALRAVGSHVVSSGCSFALPAGGVYYRIDGDSDVSESDGRFGS